MKKNTRTEKKRRASEKRVGKKKGVMERTSRRRRRAIVAMVAAPVTFSLVWIGAEYGRLFVDRLKYSEKFGKEPIAAYVGGVRTYLTDRRPVEQSPEYYKFQKDSFWARPSNRPFEGRLINHIPTEFFIETLGKRNFIQLHGDLRFKSFEEAARVMPKKIFELMPRELSQKESNHMGKQFKKAKTLIALDRRVGSCLERASVMCAIFRANKIPARVVGFYGVKSSLFGNRKIHWWVEAYDSKRKAWIAIPNSRGEENVTKPNSDYFVRRCSIAEESRTIDFDYKASMLRPQRK